MQSKCYMQNNALYCYAVASSSFSSYYSLYLFLQLIQLEQRNIIQTLLRRCTCIYIQVGHLCYVFILFYLFYLLYHPSSYCL